MTNNDKIFQLKEAFIKINEDLICIRGVEPIVGRILGLILLSPLPLSQFDIEKMTGYSRSQISRHLKALESRTEIVKRSRPGSKTFIYEARIKSLVDNFRSQFSPITRLIKQKVEELNDILDQWDTLSVKQKESPEGKKIREVLIVYIAALQSALDVMNDFSERFEVIFKKIEKDLTKNKLEKYLIFDHSQFFYLKYNKLKKWIDN